MGPTRSRLASSLLETHRQRIEAAWTGLGNRLTMDNTGIYKLDLAECKQVTSLAPLKGIPLTSLSIMYCPKVSDLSPLKDMPLRVLNIQSTEVRDLSPLKGMPLTYLVMGHCGVRDLSPLKGLPLTWLDFHCCYQVNDLSPLVGMPLTGLSLYLIGPGQDLTLLQEMNLVLLLLTPHHVTKGMEMLRHKKNLKTIGITADPKDQFPAVEFWKKYDAGEFKPTKP